MRSIPVRTRAAPLALRPRRTGRPRCLIDKAARAATHRRAFTSPSMIKRPVPVVPSALRYQFRVISSVLSVSQWSARRPQLTCSEPQSPNTADEAARVTAIVPVVRAEAELEAV
jgi:hypothetical protein